MDFTRLIPLCFALFSFSVFADVAVSFRDPIVLSQKSDGSWYSNLGIEAKASNKASRIVKTSVALRAASVGRMVFSAASRVTPYGIALSAALEAYDYFYNDKSGSIEGSPSVIPKSEFSKSEDMNKCDGERVGCISIGYERVCGYTKTVPFSTSIDGIVINNCTNLKAVDGRFPVKLLIPTSKTSFPETAPTSVSIPSSKTVSIDDIGNLFLDKQLPLLQKVINDAVSSGSYAKDWPELAQRIDEIKSALDTPDASTELSTQKPAVENDAPAVEPESDSLFCDWAPKVCAAMDFILEPFAEPVIPEMPVKTVSPVDWDSGLSAGSCPSFPSITLQGQTLTIDTSDICWAASSVFKPILIALSLISAAFILAGVRT